MRNVKTHLAQMAILKKIINRNDLATLTDEIKTRLLWTRFLCGTKLVPIQRGNSVWKVNRELWTGYAKLSQILSILMWVNWLFYYLHFSLEKTRFFPTLWVCVETIDRHAHWATSRTSVRTKNAKKHENYAGQISTLFSRFFHVNWALDSSGHRPETARHSRHRKLQNCIPNRNSRLHIMPVLIRLH